MVSEVALFRESGADALEDALESAEVDVADLGRSSAV